jgi:hypothetical protein
MLRAARRVIQRLARNGLELILDFFDHDILDLGALDRPERDGLGSCMSDVSAFETA